MIKGIVFDLDGTLVDSLSATFDAFNHGIVHLGGQKLDNKEIMKHFGLGEGEIFAKLVGAEKAQEAYQASIAFMNSQMGQIPLHEGIKEVLEHLQTAKIPVSIFTGRSWPTTELILKHHGLSDYFVTVVASDHVSYPKPSPEGLHLALSRMKLLPQDVLFIGDSPMDMMASRAAGSQGVAALWDLLADRNSMESYQPHHWAKLPKEIIEILEAN